MIRLAKEQQVVCVIAAITVVYLILATQAFEQPGIYMDAINPDYLVARMLNAGTQTTASILPGNLLWKRWPLMAGGLYHGSIHAYLTLPFYAALGGTVFSLRLAHLCLGLSVLLCMAFFVWKATHSRLAVAAATLALATDPAFIFTFRTQAYIATFPLVLILLGLGLLFLPGDRTRKQMLVVGLCLGAAIWGYFIYSFMIPGIVLFVVADGRPLRSGISRLLPLLVGIGIGLLPYAIGYASLFIRVGGLAQGLAWLAQAVAAAHVNSNEVYLDRLAFVLRQVIIAITGTWHWVTFFGVDLENVTGQKLKLLGLLLLPFAALPLALRPGQTSRAFWIIGLPIVSYVLVASLFGSRLGGHHFCLLLPLLYTLAAISLRLLSDRFVPPKAEFVAFGLPCIAALAVNLVLFNSFISRLERLGGAGLYSSGMTDYPVRLRSEGDLTPHVFLDWGGLFQFIYLTEGQILAYDATQLNAVLCRYHGGNVVVLGKDARVRGLQEMQDAGIAVTGIEQTGGRAPSDFQFVVLKVVPPPSYCR